MKSLKVLSLLCVCILVCGSILRPVVTYASPYDLMLNTDSNALMTMELDDLDYSVMPMSSIGTVANTVTASSVPVYIALKNSSGNTRSASVSAVYSSGRFRFNFTAPDGWYVDYFQPQLYKGYMPNPGTYIFSFDYASDFSCDYSSMGIYTEKKNNNANLQSRTLVPSYQYVSGDLYVASYTLNLTNLQLFGITLNPVENMVNIGGSFAIRFQVTTSDADAPSTAGTNTSAEDAQIEISNNVAALQNTTNSIFDSLQDLIQHISNQLAALWDQMYNYMHVPHMAKLDEVISAIGNIDIEFQIDFDELKTSINNMSTAVQNKLQATTDQITGGYDNSGMNQDQQLLDDTLTQYEEVENEVISDAKENISGFEFEDGLSEFAGPLEDISYFLGAIFTGLGAMNVIISFSLTLTIAMCMIGWYRFKGGK